MRFDLGDRVSLSSTMWPALWDQIRDNYGPSFYWGLSNALAAGLRIGFARMLQEYMYDVNALRKTV